MPLASRNEKLPNGKKGSYTQVQIDYAYCSTERHTMLHQLDLFSGYGGFALSLRNTGYFEPMAFCEIDTFCHRILSKNFPGKPIIKDVRHAIESLERINTPRPDIITAGFPCQDISPARRGEIKGLDGEQSGLWFAAYDVISHFRPRYILLENAPNIVNVGLSTITHQLTALGYDCVWRTIRAADFALPHFRERWFLVAYSRRQRFGQRQNGGELPSERQRHTDTPLYDWWRKFFAPIPGSEMALPKNYWLYESPICGIVDGVADRLDNARIKALGNGVVIPVIEWLGERIVELDSIME